MSALNQLIPERALSHVAVFHVKQHQRMRSRPSHNGSGRTEEAPDPADTLKKK